MSNDAAGRPQGLPPRSLDDDEDELSEQIDDSPQQPGLSPESFEPTPGDEVGADGRAAADREGPSKVSIAVASVFMVLPSVIPFYYAVNADDSTMMLVMLAFGFGVLLINALIFVMVYRWILRMMD